MSNRKRSTPLLAFEALSVEGALLTAEWTARVARLEAPHQSEADYGIPKGLTLRDEIGRSWRIAQAHWAEMEAGRAAAADPRSTAERFTRGLLSEVLRFGSLNAVPPVEIGDRTFPIGHAALGGRVPLVVAPAGGGLDTAHEHLGDGHRKRSAFGLAQEYLNAQPAALWGLACDGATLRLLRDNASLTRPAWIEADLVRIFTEELYSDFAALWLLVHESRFGRPDQPPDACPLEAWREGGLQDGDRAREKLRLGVEEALKVLGQGFLAHPDNGALRTALHSGALSTDAYFGELLRVVYRIIFLLTVEERGLLHPRRTPEALRSLYADGYGFKRLRDRSARRAAHDREGDLWDAAQIVFRSLAEGEPRLGLPALGGLFAPHQCPHLDRAALQNRTLLLALFRLGWMRERAGLVRVNWRDMGPEELGSVYEGLLELVPRVSQDGRKFSFATDEQGRATARKETGSYYTPDSLVQALLDVSLEPVIQRTLAESPGQPVRALLRLTVVDPACGSGHFLLGAARRIAAHLAQARTEGTPSADEYRDALRTVVGRCIYGVDLNPMAVELCRVALWMEAVVPGRPLSFLEAHIRHGNALVGTTPELMEEGVPDDAWTAVEGDDKKVASRLKKANKQWRQTTLFGAGAVEGAVELATLSEAAEEAEDDSLAAVHAKAKAWADYEASPAVQRATLLSDLWCAAFFWPKVEGEAEKAAPVRGLWEGVRGNERTLPATTARMKDELRERYSFFHWPIAFPQVFARGGFDVVLGNPPWDTLSPDAKEFFARWDPEIRQQKKAEQDVTIARLCESPDIAAEWSDYRRRLFTWVHFLKRSGRFVMYAPGNLGKGDFNVYRMFVETALSYCRPRGYAAQVAPDGLYSGANTAAIRAAMLEDFSLDPLLGFENAAGVWFPGVHRSQKLCIYAAHRVRSETRAIRARFGIRTQADLQAALGGDLLRIPVSLIREFSPAALAVMEFDGQVDIDIAAKLYERWPNFGEPCGWWDKRPYRAEIHMGNNRDLFSEDQADIPLYEGRMVTQYDHRAKGYRGGRGRAAKWDDLKFGDVRKSIQPQWFIPPALVPEKTAGRLQRYRIGWCDVTGPRNERTLLAALIPQGVLCGDSVPTMMFKGDYEWAYLPVLAALNSFVADYVMRGKVSLHIKFNHMDTLPVPRLKVGDSAVAALARRVLRLTCTGPEMTPFWNQMAAHGWVQPVDPSGPVPGELDEEERLRLAAEIEVIIARDLYGLSPDEMAHVLRTFPIVERRQTEKFGEYRTYELIRALWDDLPPPGLKSSFASSHGSNRRMASRPQMTGGAAIRESYLLPSRVGLLNGLVQKLRQGGSSVLIGPRRSGRTALCRAIAQAEPGRVFILSLAGNSAWTSPRPWVTPDGLATMLEPSLEAATAPAEALRQTWAELEPQQRPFVVLDDAEGLIHAEPARTPTTFAWLRSIGQESASVLFVASRAEWRRVMAVAREEDGSSFGNDVAIFKVPPLHEEEARRLVSLWGLDPSRQQRALALGGRWPGWLSLAASVIASAEFDHASDAEVLDQILRRAGAHGRAEWSDYSTDAIRAGQRLLRGQDASHWPSRLRLVAQEEGLVDSAGTPIIVRDHPPFCAWLARLPSGGDQ